MMKRFHDYIGSRRFAIILLIATSSVILLSNLLPDIAGMRPEEAEALRRARPLLFYAAERLQLRRVIHSPLFLLLPLFIFMSVTVCTVSRVKAEMRAWKRPRTGGGRVSYEGDFSGTPEQVLAFLERRGWAPQMAEDEKGVFITGSKGRKGFWGSVVFHAGIIVVLIGAALSVLTRFNSVIILTEGFDSGIEEASFGRLKEDFPFWKVLLKKFTAEYREGFPVDFKIDLTLWTGEGTKEGAVKVNEPLSVAGYQFTAGRYGFSPRFVMKKGDTAILDAHANLVVISPDMIDYIRVPEEGITVAAQFFPEYYMERRTPKTRSREPKNPVFFVEVKDDDGKVLGRGFLPMGKEVSFSDYTLEFKDLRMWVTLGMSRDLGVPAIFIGFFLIVPGLAVRFIWSDKTLWVRLEGGRFEAGGWSRYSPHLFEEEIRDMAEELRDDKV